MLPLLPTTGSMTTTTFPSVATITEDDPASIKEPGSQPNCGMAVIKYSMFGACMCRKLKNIDVLNQLYSKPLWFVQHS